MSDLIELAETVAQSLYRDGKKRVPAVIDALRYEIERLGAKSILDREARARLPGNCDICSLPEHEHGRGDERHVFIDSAEMRQKDEY